MAVKFLSDGHFSGSSTDLTLDSQLFLPSFSNTPGASPTISFDSGSGGISYRNAGGSSDQLWFRAGGSNMAYINTAGIHSSGNLYTANAGDFRNYGGEWHATTGVTGNGFKFTNTADSIDALTLSATGNAVFAGDVTVSGGQLFLGGSTYALENVSGNYGIRNSNGHYGGSDGTNAYSTPQDFFHIPGIVRVGPKYATSDRDYIRLVPAGTTSTIEMPNENAIIHNNQGNIVLRTGASTDAVTVSGSNTTFAGSVTANSFIKSGGTSSEYLMADGSVSTGGSGISQADADLRYVNVTGDTMTGNLSIEAGSPILTLKDTTDDDDQKIQFMNSLGTVDYLIQTQDFTTNGTGGDGFYLGSKGSDEVAIVTNNAVAALFHSNQDLTINGLISQTDTQGDNSFVGNILLQNAFDPKLRIYRTNGATTKYGITTTDIGEIGTTSNHEFRIIQYSGAALTIDTSKNATITGNLTVSGTGQSSFGGQVTIPATPVAATDAASKSYVDAQIGANNDLQEVTDNGATTTNAITTGNITANGSILGGGNLFLRSYNTDPKGIFFRDGFEYGDTNQYNLSITIYDDGDGAADGMNINAYDGIYFNVQSGTTPSTAFRVLNGEVRSYKTLIANSTFQMNDSNTNLVISGNTSGNATIDNNTGSIAFQANGSTVNSMTITSSAITLNENTAVTGTFDPQGNILGAVIDDGNAANPLQVRRSAASTMQVGINFTVSPSSGSGFSRYLGVDASADLRFGSNTNHGTNALVLTTANYVSQFGSFAGDIVPSADSTYDLGSNASKWAEGHFDHLYVGETGNNPRIDIYTENGTTSIADTFADTSTDKSYIYFQAGTSSNDPGYIMHETSESASPNEQNEGVLHLVPSDDNSTGDYVSIHGTNDPDCIKLHTSGLIETANYQLQLRSDVGDVYINDGLTVNGTIAATGGTSTTWNEAHDNMIISASVSGTSTKTLTLNQNDGGTITASWTDLQGTTISAPNAPTNLSLSVVNNTVNVTFDASSTSGIDQYLVFGSANGGDYSLISVIAPDDMSATMSVIDDSFDDSGAQAYRVYAMKTGVMSSALSGSVTYTVTTPVEPTNMSVVNLNTAFYIQWDPPSSNARFVTAYNVYVHEHATQASLSRSSATLIYSGMNTSYMYEISGNNNLNYHQFWVETTVT